jgi:UDP-N-acetylglucosamine acyltransferase
MSAAGIHASAVIDPSARLGTNVSVGAFTVIGPDVEIGDGTRIGAHCSILGPTRIGRDNHVHGHAAIGGDPQDKKYQGERVELVIGDRNVIREFVTLNRGTGNGGGITRIGDDNWLLAYTHVAHDCHIGSHCVFSNNTTLAGHVSVGDWVIMSGFSGAHQFCRIGAHAFIGMGALISGDVPPFVMVAQSEQGRPRGINSEGLKRRGFDSERISAIKRAYRALYVSGDTLEQARAKLGELAQGSEDVRAFLEFIDSGERPLLR